MNTSQWIEGAIDPESVQSVVAPGVDGLDDFIHWWNLVTDNPNKSPIVADLSALDDDLRRAAAEIVGASGHREVTSQPSHAANDTGASVLVVAETVFADIETRSHKLEEFYNYFRLTLESIARQRPVEGTQYLHFVYISGDKAREVLRIATLINRLNRESRFAELRLVIFQHPADGYPAPENGQIDATFRPSTKGQRPSELLAKAMANNQPPQLDDFDLYLRATIDDDDLWLPWTIQEFVASARAAADLGGRAVKYIGIPNQMLFYQPIDFGRLDSVRMRMVMHGSKFAMSNDWSLLIEHHPWMLPEPFSQNMARFMRRRSVDLKINSSGRPCFIYVRRHGRLSAVTKYEHYVESPRTRCFVPNEEDIVRHAVELAGDTGEPGEATFGIDPPTLEARGELHGETLVVRLNVEELSEGHGIDPDDHYVTVKCRTADGDQVTRHEFRDELEIDPSGWEGRSGLSVLSKDTDTCVFNTWIRGKEPYLS